MLDVMFRALVASVVMSTVALPASADVIAAPPDDCPATSAAVDFCHGPPTCAARECDTEGECEDGETCAETDLCVRESCCSGRCCAGGCGEEPTVYLHVEGSCDSCDPTFGLECRSVKVCVPSGDVDAGPPEEPDAGPLDEEDAGPRDEVDAGGEGEDAGSSSEEDAGSTEEEDAGRAGVDAGESGPEGGGGCCAVFGGRSGGPALLVMLGLAAVLLRRRTR